ncbi:serine/threonine protein kinase [Thalassoglobus neptunius]|uniref:serine/threonine protein kinase n=1 Tax=Thalassoglobus neptunius TaxID=1938619 RepID=UPI001E40B255|nr:serine/threonine-protein kinase [Thalassoglobus neptunius]
MEKFPDFAQEIRELWATIIVAENLHSPISDPGKHEGTPTQSSELPEINDYELIAEIGRGGMGVVYEARQISLNRTVAIKMLLQGASATSINHFRFQSEAKSAGRLDHPNIVSVFETGNSEGHPFFSMPLINGTTLAKRIAEGPLSNRECAELMIPVCRGVAYAHRQGVLHRDLKPSNILIDETGRPFVSDFGLAKRFDTPSLTHGENSDTLTESGAILGTPGYMAPEQAAGQREQVGLGTDIYSLGAILYACLTGRAPFQSATPIDTLMMILEQDPPLPRLLNPAVDTDLEMIVLKAMQKPADLRYATADSLADDLQAFLNHEPVSARSSHFSQVLSRAFRSTHHINVLENWGVLWMWHAAVLLFLCLATEAVRNSGIHSRIPYFGLWTFGLGTWAVIFWNLRRRSGPVTFVERQIAHVWAASMACSTGLFGIEYLLDLPALTLSPVLALFAGAVFIAKAGILSGEFYIHATILFLTAIPMAIFPQYALSIFGVISAGTFFLPGWKFHRIKHRSER